MTGPEVPEGRCMVCRAAWEPCRRCRGKALAAKQQATMERNGTKPKRPKRGPDPGWALKNKPEYTHRVQVKERRPDADP